MRDLVVAGKPVLLDGAPAAGRPGAAEVSADFERTMKKLWGG
jgi:hypothetical protein